MEKPGLPIEISSVGQNENSQDMREHRPFLRCLGIDEHQGQGVISLERITLNTLLRYMGVGGGVVDGDVAGSERAKPRRGGPKLI